MASVSASKDSSRGPKEPQNPIEWKKVYGNEVLPDKESRYIKDRKYLNLPDEDFRLPLPETDRQKLIFSQWMYKHVKIPPVRSGEQIGKNQPVGSEEWTAADVIIPQQVNSQQATESSYPVHVIFHGGGFCTGSATFRPWIAAHIREISEESNAIVFMPHYGKMPEYNGRRIMKEVSTFWAWYLEDKLFKDVLLPILPKQYGEQMFEKIKRKDLLISGDSAGGFLAAYSWVSQCRLTVKALYLRYPMLRAYTRDAGHPYRDKVIEEAKIQEYAQIYYDHVKSLIDNRLLTPRFESPPPEGMDMAYLFSSAKKEVFIDGQKTKISFWKYRFNFPDILDQMAELICEKEARKAPATQAGQTKATVSTIKHAADESDVPDFVLPPTRNKCPDHCPAIFIIHGMMDTNCPHEDSSFFVAQVRKLFPDGYIKYITRENEAHAFDYKIDRTKMQNRWLYQLTKDIGNHWTGRDTAQLDAINNPNPDTEGNKRRKLNAPEDQDWNMALDDD